MDNINKIVKILKFRRDYGCEKFRYSDEEIVLFAKQIDEVYNPPKKEINIISAKHFVRKNLKTGKIVGCSNEISNENNITFIGVDKKLCPRCGKKK